VVDPVLVKQQLLDRADDPFVVGGLLPRFKMGGEQLLLGTGLPDVEIVDLRHGGDRQQVILDLKEINAGRYGVQKRIDRLSDDLLDFAGNDDAGRQQEDRIDKAPAEEGDQQGAGNHPEIPPLITLAKIGFFSDAGCS